jgi:hypothetical protein
MVAQDGAPVVVSSHRRRQGVMLHCVCMPRISILAVCSEDTEMLVPGGNTYPGYSSSFGGLYAALSVWRLGIFPFVAQSPQTSIFTGSLLFNVSL